MDFSLDKDGLSLFTDTQLRGSRIDFSGESMTHSELHLSAPDLPSDLPGPLPEGVADQVIDARNLRCPLPLLRARQGLRHLPEGALLEVITTDSGSVRDFQVYARLSGTLLEGFREANQEFTFWLRKREGASN
jgi:tRNA 2-thiouridine synthesizing protein A